MLLGFLLSTVAFGGELYQECEWETKPIIEICPDSAMDVNDVVQSLSYWIDRGVTVDISGIQKVDHCDLSKINVIQITGYRNFDRNAYHAMTNIKWYYYGQKTAATTIYIDRATVQIPLNKINREDIVLHEIGHALGLGHSHDHIMKSNH